jgi:uncharacterized protein (DUF58 family)
MWLLCCLSLWGLGLARGDGLLTSLMSLAILLVPWARWHGLRALRGLSIEWQLPSRGMVGRPLPLRAQLTQAPGRVARGVRLELSLPAAPPHSIALPDLAGGSSLMIEETIRPQHRGVQETLRTDLLADSPWGWWRQRITHQQAHSLRMVPQILTPTTLIEQNHSREEESGIDHPHARARGEWRGLREWRAGDSLKHLHPAASARSLARGQGLMVAEHDAPSTAPAQVVVMFHSFATDRAIIRPEPFERALSLLAGTLRFWVEQQIPTTLVADFDAWCEYPCHHPRDFQELLDRLATVKRAPHTEWHDWQSAQKSLDPQACLWLISDMPVTSWQRGILPRHAPTHIIDTTKKTRSHRRKGRKP